MLFVGKELRHPRRPANPGEKIEEIQQERLYASIGYQETGRGSEAGYEDRVQRHGMGNLHAGLCLRHLRGNDHAARDAAADQGVGHCRFRSFVNSSIAKALAHEDAVVEEMMLDLPDVVDTGPVSELHLFERFLVEPPLSVIVPVGG